jgi:hypothetical protein
LFESITPFGSVDKDALRMPIEQSGRAGQSHRELHLKKSSSEIFDIANGGGGAEFPRRRFFAQ